MDDYDGQIIPGDEHGLNFLTSVLWIRENPGKNLNQEIDPTGDQIRARWTKRNYATPDICLTDEEKPCKKP